MQLLTEIPEIIISENLMDVTADWLYMGIQK